MLKSMMKSCAVQLHPTGSGLGPLTSVSTPSVTPHPSVSHCLGCHSAVFPPLFCSVLPPDHKSGDAGGSEKPRRSQEAPRRRGKGCRRERNAQCVGGSVLSVVPGVPWMRGDDCTRQPQPGSRSCRRQGGDSGERPDPPARARLGLQHPHGGRGARAAPRRAAARLPGLTRLKWELGAVSRS